MVVDDVALKGYSRMSCSSTNVVAVVNDRVLGTGNTLGTGNLASSRIGKASVSGVAIVDMVSKRGSFRGEACAVVRGIAPPIGDGNAGGGATLIFSGCEDDAAMYDRGQPVSTSLPYPAGEF